MNKLIYDKTIGRIVETNNIKEGDIVCHVNNYKQGLFFFSKVSKEDTECQVGSYLKLVTDDDFDEYNRLLNHKKVK